MPDLDDAALVVRPFERRLLGSSPSAPGARIAGSSGLNEKRVQEVGHQQFLMLHLVMTAEDRRDRAPPR
jgi:hypothetical protein